MMNKREAIRILKHNKQIFNNNLHEIINFQLKVPEAVQFYGLQNSISLLKLSLNESENKNILEHINKEIKVTNELPKIVHPMSIIYAITHFEVMLSEMNRLLMTYYWKSLISKDKTLTYKEILEFESINNLKAEIIERESNLFSFQSIRKRIEHLEKKFNLRFSYTKLKGIRKNWNCIEIDDLVEIHATRNIIVHNNCIVNNYYLTDNPNTNFKINQKRTIDDKYAIHALFVLFRVSNSLFLVIKKKIENKPLLT